MKVIVDTGVWSLALRRDKPESNATVHEFRRMIQDHRVQMIGPMRQEILSGIRSEPQFKKLQKHLYSPQSSIIPTKLFQRNAKNRTR
jgi:hypothetical protein